MIKQQLFYRILHLYYIYIRKICENKQRNIEINFSIKLRREDVNEKDLDLRLLFLLVLK